MKIINIIKKKGKRRDKPSNFEMERIFMTRINIRRKRRICGICVIKGNMFFCYYFFKSSCSFNLSHLINKYNKYKINGHDKNNNN